MDRSLSVDDLVGGIWRLGQAGMGRSDSEAALQELLKSFPSTNSLAAQAGGGGGGALSGGGPMDGGQAEDRAVQSSNGKAAPMAGFGTAGAMSAGFPATSMDLSSLPQVLQANGLHAALSAVPGLQGANHPLMAATGGLSPAAAAAAAALQLSQLGGSAAGVHAPMGAIDRESLEKAEQRRARRMLSNRESARRSRRRKQEHLLTMEDQINILVEDKRKWTEEKESLERRCQVAEEEGSKLREENQRLRDELRILDLVKSDLLGRSFGSSLKDFQGGYKEPADQPVFKRVKMEGEVGQNVPKSEQDERTTGQCDQDAVEQGGPENENDLGGDQRH